MEPQSDNTPSSAPQPTTAEQDEIISWTKQRQQQAQQRILETLMYSGAGQEEKPAPRRRKKKNNNQQQKKQTNSKEFDVEEALKSIMGNEYKSVSKKKKTKKKKKRKNKPQAKQEPKEQPRVKTAEERMYRSATPTGGKNELTVDFDVAGFTVCGDYTRPGIQVPERAMCFEASGATGPPAQNLFISSSSPKNLYGFCYQAESAELICCSNAMVDGLESLLQSWQMILNSDKFEAEMVAEEDEEPQDDEEDVANEEEERESDEEEDDEEEDDGPFATFPSTGESHMYLPEISLQAHAFDSGNDSLAYSFSTVQNPKRYLLTYIANANQPFLRKQTNILNSNAVVMNCTFLDKNVEDMESGQISWKQISSFILDNPETTFLLTCFDSGVSHSDIHSFFSSLVQDGELDLSNVILFIPPQENQV